MKNIFIIFMLSTLFIYAPSISAQFRSPQSAINKFSYDQGWRVDKHPRLLADVNGDGRADIVGFSNNSVFVSLGRSDGMFGAPIAAVNNFGYDQGWRVEKNPRLLGDVNGDGRADIVGFSNSYVLVSLGRVDGKFDAPQSTIDNFGYNKGWRVDKHPRWLTDVNGDGRADIVGFGNNCVLVSLGKLDGKFNTPRASLCNLFSSYNWRKENHHVMLGNVVDNNSGVEIVGLGDKIAWVSTSDRDGNFDSPISLFNKLGDNQVWRVERNPRMLAIVYGNKSDDIVGFGDDYVWVSISRATDATFFEPYSTVNNFGYNKGWRVDKHPRILADVNRDSRADIVGFGNDYVFVSLAKRNGRYETVQETINNFCYNKGWRVDKHPRMLADINGDGKKDIVGFGDRYVWVSISNFPLDQPVHNQILINPNNLKLNIGERKNITVNLPSKNSNSITVKLTSDNDNVILSSSAIIIPPNVTKFTFTVIANKPGKSFVKVEVPGYQSSSLEISIAKPYIELRLTPQKSSIVWGKEAIFNLSIQSHNSFSGRVNLKLERPPVDIVAYNFSPTTINLAPNTKATSTLTLTTKEGAAKVFSQRINVKAEPQSNGIESDIEQIGLTILRTPGRFIPVSLKTQNSNCGIFAATVVPLGNGPGIRFSSSTTSTIAIAFSAGYAFSPKCNVGLVVPPVANISNVPYHTINCWNLGFPLSQARLGRMIFGTDGLLVSAYFSPDDSLLLLETIADSQTAGHQSIYRLYDLIKGQLLGGTNGRGTFIESVILNGDIVTLKLKPTAQYTWRIR